MIIYLHTCEGLNGSCLIGVLFSGVPGILKPDKIV